MLKIQKLGLVGIFFVNLFIIVASWCVTSSALFTDVSNILLALGRLCGLLAVYFVLLQFILMGRTMWVERVFGLDKLANVHRLNGYLSILFILTHAFFIIFSYSMLAKVNFFGQVADFILHYDDMLWAVIALCIFVAVVFLSIYIVRKRLRYEIWYFIHLLTYLAVVLAFGHQLTFGGDFLQNKWFELYWYFLYLFVFTNVLIFRFLKPFYLFFSHRFMVSEIVSETDEVSSLTITGKNLEQFKIQPGQFMILRFLAKGFWWQAHPFSLSCCPNGKYLRVSIKKLGDFTSKVPAIKPGTSVFIDGPYGVFTAQHTSSTKYLFIAAGIGITPIRSLLEKVADGNDVILLYSNKNSSQIVFRKELDELSAKYHFRLYYVITDEPEYSGEKGRIDKEKLKRLVKDVSEREAYICGPLPMMMATEAALRDLGVAKNHIHYEKFAL